MVMDSWRRQRSDNYNQEVTGTRSQNRKPPLGSWQPTEPSWEKKFCTVVGSLPWRKLLENKFIHLYDNVLKWNDSAGEEAFHNAKYRFWAEMNGLHCDILLPDPDIYIDKIDWNSNIDPELLLDLERESVVPADREKGEQVVILGEPLVLSQLLSSTGWGDAEEDLKETTYLPLENRANPWDINCAQANGAGRENGWEDDGWNNSQRWNRWENNNYGTDNLKDRRTAGVWEQWDANNRNGENTGRSLSRYKTSRFHGDDHLEWKNGKGRKKASFVCEQPFIDKRPGLRQWNLMSSCGPVSHHRSANPGDQWGWEKPIS